MSCPRHWSLFKEILILTIQISERKQINSQKWIYEYHESNLSTRCHLNDTNKHFWSYDRRLCTYFQYSQLRTHHAMIQRTSRRHLSRASYDRSDQKQRFDVTPSVALCSQFAPTYGSQGPVNRIESLFDVENLCSGQDCQNITIVIAITFLLQWSSCATCPNNIRHLLSCWRDGIWPWSLSWYDAKSPPTVVPDSIPD